MTARRLTQRPSLPALMLVVAATVAGGARFASAAAIPATVAKPAAAAGAKPAATPKPNAAAAPAAAAPAAEAGDKVKITIRTVPVRRAIVTWGGKRLGITEPGKPLIVERPRDSGPMDVIIRAIGFVPVSTRAYTFKDGTLAVKLTPVDQKNTLFGYREELPPEEGTADGSAVPAASPMGTSPGAKPGVPVPPAGAPGAKPAVPPLSPPKPAAASVLPPKSAAASLPPR